MRIARIDLKAYGHFTNYGLALPTAPDLHIVYGPNEAGKSTISRALEAALFGFPHNTADDFLHPYGSLRVGLVIESGNEILAVMRRKGIKNTVVKYDAATGEETGEAVGDDVLPRHMGGLSNGLYASMFALDHDELVAGGRALSEGQGEIGQSLFAAGAGLTAINALREALTRKADELFRPRASTSAVFRTLDGYGQAKAAAKAALTRPAVWEQLRKEAEAAGDGYAKAKVEQERLQHELRRLERLAAVLPDVAARTQVRERMAAMGDVRRLDADARQQRIQAETLLRHERNNLTRAEANLGELQAELTAVPTDPVILAEASAVEAVFHQRAGYRDAQDAAVRAKSRIDWASGQATGLAHAIGETLRDDLRTVIPTATQRARVLDLVNQGRAVKAALQQAEEAEEEASAELQRIAHDLAVLGAPDVPESLKASLHAFDANGNAESKASELACRARTDRSTLEQAAKVLTDRPLDEFVAMALPLSSELQSFSDARSALASDKVLLTSSINKLEDDMAAVTGEIEGLEQGGEVPTAEHLAERRQARDGLWARIRQKAFPDGKASETPVPSPGEYELAVQAADGTADARFADVNRVSRHADLRARQAQMHNALELERRRLAATKEETLQLDQRWEALLNTHRLPSLDAARLSEWIAKRQSIVERHQACVELDAQAYDAARTAKAARAGLSAALLEAGLPACSEGESLAQAIARARERVRQAGESATEAKVLERQRAQATTRRNAAATKIADGNKDLADWRGAWARAMADIRLKDDALELEATARLRQLEQLAESLDTLDAARSELAAAHATQSRIDAEVDRLCAVTAHESGQRPVEAIIETLHERLGKARLQADRARDVASRIEGTRTAKDAAEGSVALANETLASLMAAAGCDSLENLAAAEQRSADLLHCEADLVNIEERLVKASAMPLADLLEQAATQDLVQVQADLDRTTSDLASATDQVEGAHAKLIDTRNALAQIDGAAKASTAEQDAAAAAARLSMQIADYTAVTVASAILSDVIDTYQQRHQGPLLARASDLFAAITGGLYAKVVTDFQEEKTVLVAVTHGGTRKRVEALSSGRRDQLFLALRLAAIESHVASQEPVPVVVDDIVINFDDAAASATFTVLAELAKRTQVLFFTHHEHLLERAQRALGAGNFQAHVLPGASARMELSA
ncbi:MAG: AAA family ATPase [Betaproteobacteria bacterium]|nr:AAA family ATPase [Betaproteobacteria bacterium]